MRTLRFSLGATILGGALLSENTAEAIQSLPIISFWSVFTAHIRYVEHARCSLQCASLLPGEYLYQSTSAAWMRFPNVDLKTMAVVRSFNINQQSFSPA
jgi:hypothetical protein